MSQAEEEREREREEKEKVKESGGWRCVRDKLLRRRRKRRGIVGTGMRTRA